MSPRVARSPRRSERRSSRYATNAPSRMLARIPGPRSTASSSPDSRSSGVELAGSAEGADPEAGQTAVAGAGDAMWLWAGEETLVSADGGASW
ncbi:hypothetical protein [Georgenia sp. Z1491]|uniref:hypothetical protein n=1 Tax=Georgenia sp. Z1491 TaxID=3416707 RepID=UPI003CEE2CA7